MFRAGRLAPGKGCEGVLALILANGRGRALEGLTAWQTKAAVPFGGQYRIVDFVLSNCVNSEIRSIALLTQYKSQSLIRHVHAGWGFLHRELGEFVEIWPAQQQDGERWYRGTVDAVHQNTDLIEATGASHVLVLGCDQLYALDYGPLIELHLARGADVTVGVRARPRSQRARRRFHRAGRPRRAHRAPAADGHGAAPLVSRGDGRVPVQRQVPERVLGPQRRAARHGRLRARPRARSRAHRTGVRPCLRHARAAALLANAEHRGSVLARAHGAARQPRPLRAACRWRVAGVHAPRAAGAGPRARRRLRRCRRS